jgi:hypothetical protein
MPDIADQFPQMQSIASAIQIRITLITKPIIATGKLNPEILLTYRTQFHTRSITHRIRML